MIKRIGCVAVTVACLLLAGCTAGPPVQPAKVSSFGHYSGYSEPVYDGWHRQSEYVPMADGVRLAVDTYLPTASGAEPQERVPVVLHYTRYGRATESDGTVTTLVDTELVLQHLLCHGYAVAVADTRGSGASFGVHDGPLNAAEAADAYTLIEWLAARPWCNARVGMHGRSYPGITQYHAAAQVPPHLEAIFAEMAGPSPYDFIRRGGTYQENFVTVWGRWTAQRDRGSPAPARVDGDDGTLRAAAIVEHAANLGPVEINRTAPFRDSRVMADGRVRWSWEMAGALDDAAKIDGSGVAIYHLMGWYDTYSTEQLLLFANLRSTPQKAMIGPWTHTGGIGGVVHRAEILRWYDYWLKGIDNGVMDEPPIHYYVIRDSNTVPESAEKAVSADESRADDGRTWIAAQQWPPAGIRAMRYYLAGGPSGTIASRYDGRLTTQPRAATDAGDTYGVDYTASGGSFTRWTNSYGARRAAPKGSTFFDERTAEERKGLTYTSEPLPSDLLVVGSPIVRLWVSSSHADGDFFAWVSEVEATGRSHYVTEGALRASHRALAPAPFANFSLPYHRSFASDVEPLPREPVELVFALMGTATVFDAGHRIRLAVTGSSGRDSALYPDPTGHEAPVMTVFHEERRRSLLELPVLEKEPPR